jgi:hypothetical protein
MALGQLPNFLFWLKISTIYVYIFNYLLGSDPAQAFLIG